MYPKDHYSAAFKRFIGSKIRVGDLLEKLQYEEGSSPQCIVNIQDRTITDSIDGFQGECIEIYHGDIRPLIEVENDIITMVLDRFVDSYVIIPDGADEVEILIFTKEDDDDGKQ